MGALIWRTIRSTTRWFEGGDTGLFDGLEALGSSESCLQHRPHSLV